MTETRSKVRLENHEPGVELDPETTKSAIVELLYRNDEYGYQPQAVHEELDIPHNTSKGTLRRLKQEGYIDQTEDGYYHAREDREDLSRYVGAVDGLDRMLTEYDAESEGEGTASDESSLTEEEIEDSIDVFEDEE
jgi:Mn-dependent DtxR family transcriptional regulator